MAKLFAYHSVLTCCLSFYMLITNFGCFAANQGTVLEREPLPTEENALSLWLIARTGWIFCDRAAEYTKKIDKQFDTTRCKNCYITLFNKYKLVPKKLTNEEILTCAGNFGISRPFIPSIGFPPSPAELLHQNPFESIAVQPFTCNSDLRAGADQGQESTPNRNGPNFRQWQIPMPSLRQMTQLLSIRGFSHRNDPKVEYPRRSYVICLLGAIFETELAMCPMNTSRRRCAAEKKKVDEDLILSTSVPISYTGTNNDVTNEGQTRSMQYINW